MSRIVFRAALAALVVALAGPSLPAYLIRRSNQGAEVVWSPSTPAANVVAGKVTYYIDKNSVGGGLGITGDQFAGAVRAAVQSWEDVPGSSIAFTEDSARSTSSKNASDKINRFGFNSGVLGPLEFGVAFTLATNNRVTDVDMVFNPTLLWSVQSPGEVGHADVQSVATHEWGHGLGFDHCPLARSTMFYAAEKGAVTLRTLEADDKAGVSHLYPSSLLATDYALVQGRVLDTTGAPVRGAEVIAIDFVTGFPAVSGLSLADGTFEMEGVPPGVYRVVAAPIGSTRLAAGTYSPFWNGSKTDFFPSIRSNGDGSTTVTVLAGGQTLQNVNLTVSTSDSTGEPNDQQGQAHGIAVGASVGGRCTSLNDADWYSFPGTAGQTVSAYVHAKQIGSDLDARLILRRPDGSLATFVNDISQDFFGPDGVDLDSRILDYPIDETGTWFVIVDPESEPDPSAPEDYFYVLSLFPGGGAPSTATSTLVASPAVLPADGATGAVITFTPRSLTGTLSGGSLDVTMNLVADGNADGSLGTVTDHKDGTYTATLTAAASGGSDVVRALVDGVPIATTTVNFRGPPSFAASDFTASPRRIRPGGSVTSTVTLLPRDAAGIEFGAGLAVTLAATGSPDAIVGPTSDGGDGTYTATVTAGAAREILQVGATVDGSGLGGTIPVGIGFPLGDVLDDTQADLAAMLAGDPAPPPAKAVAKVSAAKAALAAAQDQATLPNVVKGIVKAVKALDAAGKKGASVAALSSELAESVREAGLDAIAAAGPAADLAKEQAALTKAQGYVTAGDSLIAAGQASKALAKYAAVFRQTGLVK